MKNKIYKNINHEKQLNKRTIIIAVLIFIVIISLICFFMKMNDKNKNIGNNMSNKNIKEIEDYILNISSYQAKISVIVESNKNTNKYLLEQTYKKGSLSKQVILEPSNIQGLEIIYENNTLKISNSKLGLTTVYENYEYIVGNHLWLDSFIADYRQCGGTIKEDNGIIIMKTKTRDSNNKYVYEKELVIDKKTGKPTKMLIQDINQKKYVYILYNEITVNGLQ